MSNIVFVGTLVYFKDHLVSHTGLAFLLVLLTCRSVLQGVFARSQQLSFKRTEVVKPEWFRGSSKMCHLILGIWVMCSGFNKISWVINAGEAGLSEHKQAQASNCFLKCSRFEWLILMDIILKIWRYRRGVMLCVTHLLFSAHPENKKMS